MNKIVLFLSRRWNKLYHCQPRNMASENHFPYIIDLGNSLLLKLKTLLIMLVDNI